MADTRRTVAQLLTQLADNSLGAITPQVMRDLLLSLVCYGSLRSVAPHNEVVSTTPARYQDFDETGPSAGCIVDRTTNFRITVPVDGDYRVDFSASHQQSSSRAIWSIRKNGGAARLGGLFAIGAASAVDERYSIAFSDIVTLSAADYLEVWLAGSGAGLLVKVEAAAFTVERVG